MRATAETNRRGRLVRSLGVLGLAGALVLGAAAPAFADPDIPHPGTRPAPGAPVTGAPGTPGLPGGSPGPGTGGVPGGPVLSPPDVDPPALGPLGARITAEQRAVEALGEQVKDAETRVTDLRTLLDTAKRTASAADEMLERAENRTENAAGEAYRDSAALPEPIRELTSDLQHLAPGLRQSASVESKVAADSYQAAVDLVKTSHDALDAAQKAYDAAVADLAKLRRQFQERSAALRDLLEENAKALRRAESAANRYASNINFNPGGAVNGLRPHPKAIKAVKYAMAQLGKPYVWGDEGPDTFDCSGLVYAAYRYAGVNMTARTARQQYYSTPVVAAGHMLPGDLVFFGPDKSNPESIHHNGIYIGNGKIVHAPTAGDVVKISPIWWWEFFAATRVVPAVKAAPKPAAPKPDPKPSPKPTPKPSWSTSPRPTEPEPTDPEPTDPEPTEPEPTSPEPTDSPPSPAPAPDDGRSEVPSESSPSGSACPSTSPSPSSSPTPTPTASGSATPCATTEGAASSEDAGTTRTVSYDGTEVDAAWVLLASFQNPATVANRRRTRTGVTAVRRRGPGRRHPTDTD